MSGGLGNLTNSRAPNCTGTALNNLFPISPSDMDRPCNPLDPERVTDHSRGTCNKYNSSFCTVRGLFTVYLIQMNVQCWSCFISNIFIKPALQGCVSLPLTNTGAAKWHEEVWADVTLPSCCLEVHPGLLWNTQTPPEAPGSGQPEGKEIVRTSD